MKQPQTKSDSVLPECQSPSFIGLWGQHFKYFILLSVELQSSKYETVITWTVNTHATTQGVILPLPGEITTQIFSHPAVSQSVMDFIFSPACHFSTRSGKK